MFIKGFKAVFALYFATIALATPDPQAVSDPGRGPGRGPGISGDGMSC